MARKPKKEEHVNHERWLVSYADFITLLFAFFTALYAISTVDAKKAGKLAFSTRAAFNLDFFPDQKVPAAPSKPNNIPTVNLHQLYNPVPAKRTSDSQQSIDNSKLGFNFDDIQKSNVYKSPTDTPNLIKSTYETLTELISIKKVNGVELFINKKGLIISMRDAAFFDAGQARLRKEALPILNVVGNKIISTGLDIRIEGHADDSPVHSKKSPYHSNWELSAARAASVMRYFADAYACPAKRLSIAGYGSSRPVIDADTSAARASNRRVDIVLLNP